MEAGQGRAGGEQLDEVLYGLAEGLRVVSVLLLPILPEKADRLLVALGAEERSIERARSERSAAAPRSASSSRCSRASSASAA